MDSTQDCLDKVDKDEVSEQLEQAFDKLIEAFVKNDVCAYCIIYYMTAALVLTFRSYEEDKETIAIAVARGVNAGLNLHISSPLEGSNPDENTRKH